MQSDSSRAPQSGNFPTLIITALSLICVLSVAVGAVDHSSSQVLKHRNDSERVSVMQSQPDCTPTPTPTPHQE